jgi:hypothetical protein
MFLIGMGALLVLYKPGNAEEKINATIQVNVPIERFGTPVKQRVDMFDYHEEHRESAQRFDFVVPAMVNCR